MYTSYKVTETPTAIQPHVMLRGGEEGRGERGRGRRADRPLHITPRGHSSGFGHHPKGTHLPYKLQPRNLHPACRWPLLRMYRLHSAKHGGCRVCHHLALPTGYLVWSCPHPSFRSAMHTKDSLYDFKLPINGTDRQMILSWSSKLLNEILVNFWFVCEKSAFLHLIFFSPVKTLVSPPLPFLKQSVLSRIFFRQGNPRNVQ